jgi:TetR/AcrR family transcriptional regulator
MELRGLQRRIEVVGRCLARFHAALVEEGLDRDSALAITGAVAWGIFAWHVQIVWRPAPPRPARGDELSAGREGLSTVAHHRHARPDRNLYLAIVDATFGDIVSQVERLAKSRAPAPEVLRALIAVVGDLASRRHPNFCTMMLRELLTGGTHLDPRTVPMPLRVLAAVKRIVERGVRDGAFRPVDPVLTHLSLVGSLVFFFGTARFRERVLSGQRRIAPPTADAYVRHIQDLAIHGLAAAGASGNGPRRAGQRDVAIGPGFR